MEETCAECHGYVWNAQSNILGPYSKHIALFIDLDSLLLYLYPHLYPQCTVSQKHRELS